MVGSIRKVVVPCRVFAERSAFGNMVTTQPIVTSFFSHRVKIKQSKKLKPWSVTLTELKWGRSYYYKTVSSY